jgi:hypothetical protein
MLPMLPPVVTGIPGGGNGHGRGTGDGHGHGGSAVAPTQHE